MTGRMLACVMACTLPPCLARRATSCFWTSQPSAHKLLEPQLRRVAFPPTVSRSAAALHMGVRRCFQFPGLHNCACPPGVHSAQCVVLDSGNVLCWEACWVHSRTCKDAGWIRAGQAIVVQALQPGHAQAINSLHTPGTQRVCCVKHTMRPNGHTDSLLHRDLLLYNHGGRGGARAIKT